MKRIPLGRISKAIWIPVVLIVVLSVSGLVVSRLHKQFASQDLNANAGSGIEIVQFNPKIMIYDVTGSGTAQISYFDPDAQRASRQRAAAVVDHPVHATCRPSAPT